MSEGPVDPRWPKVLSLAVHEFRTPVTVVSGYIRMLLKDRAGPLSDQQRRLLEEAEKSCGRLSALLGEVSELSALEAGTSPFNRTTVDLRALFEEAIASLPEMPEREVPVELTMDPDLRHPRGDATRLRTALRSILHALRRELVTSDRLFVKADARSANGTRSIWVAIGEGDRVDHLARAGLDALTTFDEWRGGCGLSLANARRVIEAHDGHLWSPADESKAGAVLTLPVD